MTIITRQQQCAEAVCAALYDLKFEPIAETNSGQISWFTRGRHPKDMRISVNRAVTFDGVVVTYEWRNFSQRTPIKGSDTITIPTDGGVTMQGIHDSVQAAALHALEIFKDVLEETGFAGAAMLNKYAPAHANPISTDD